MYQEDDKKEVVEEVSTPTDAPVEEVIQKEEKPQGKKTMVNHTISLFITKTRFPLTSFAFVSQVFFQFQARKEISKVTFVTVKYG